MQFRISQSFISTFVILVIFQLFGFGIACSEEEYTGELPPAQPGSSCAGTTAFDCTTSKNSPWEVVQLIAAPEGYSPEDWDGTVAFLDSFHQAIAQQPDIPGMSNALLELWQPTTAHLFAEFRRVVTIEKRQVRCVDGLWQIPPDSVSLETKTESSDWIGLEDHAVERSTASAQSIAEKLAFKLANANTQPGADTRPHHSFTTTSE